MPNYCMLISIGYLNKTKHMHERLDGRLQVGQISKKDINHMPLERPAAKLRYPAYICMNSNAAMVTFSGKVTRYTKNPTQMSGIFFKQTNPLQRVLIVQKKIRELSPHVRAPKKSLDFLGKRRSKEAGG